MGEIGVKEQVPHEYSMYEKAVMKHITWYANWEKQKKISVDSVSLMNKPTPRCYVCHPTSPCFRLGCDCVKKGDITLHNRKTLVT